MNPVLARLLAQRQSQIDFIAQLMEQVEADERDLVDAEISNLNAARQRIEELDRQIKPFEEFEAVKVAHESTVADVMPTAAPSGPRPLGARERSPHRYKTPGDFVVDLLRARGQETAGGVIPADADARQRVESALGRSITIEERAVAQQTTGDHPGLLPEPIVGEIHDDLDASRPLIASVGAKPLGVIPGKKFRRPIVVQHTTSGAQATETGELPSRQLKIEDVEFDKVTRGGSLKISRQDIDWTDPSAWNAILTDLNLTYGADTEDYAAGLFAAAITQTVTIPTAGGKDVKAWIDALYSAAVTVVTAAGTKRASALRLPNKIWTSIDMWGSLGSMLSASKTLLQQSGKAAPTAFDGDLLEIERVMAPGLPAGTMIVGRAGLFEYYEERVGLLQAVSPSTLNIEVGHGGYLACGHLDATGFAKITVEP